MSRSDTSARTENKGNDHGIKTMSGNKSTKKNRNNNTNRDTSVNTKMVTSVNTKHPEKGEDTAWSLAHKLFGPPILLPGESLARYRRQFESFADDLQPCDSIELMAIRDITDLSVEVERQRRAKADLMMPSSNPVPHGLKPHLALDTEGVGWARMTSSRIKDLALLDHMITVAQHRKYDLLAFLYRLRDVRVKAARDAGEAVVEGEFAELAPVGGTALLEIAGDRP